MVPFTTVESTGSTSQFGGTVKRIGEVKKMNKNIFLKMSYFRNESTPSNMPFGRQHIEHIQTGTSFANYIRSNQLAVRLASETLRIG